MPILYFVVDEAGWCDKINIIKDNYHNDISEHHNQYHTVLCTTRYTISYYGKLGCKSTVNFYLTLTLEA